MLINRGPNRFRIVTLLAALLFGWFSIATIFAEAMTPKAQRFPMNLTQPDPISYGSLTDWAAAAAPLRGDLLARIAIGRASPTLNLIKEPASPVTTAMLEHAIYLAKQSLSFAPHLSNMWLLVAALQSGEQTRQVGTEALKMSYLTAPAEVNLIPARLLILSKSAAIGDVDLRNLARGDIRLILTRRPDLKDAIAIAYRRGSAEGRRYVDEVTRLLDPGFAASLQ
jgi:hypothetical protein